MLARPLASALAVLVLAAGFGASAADRAPGDVIVALDALPSDRASWRGHPVTAANDALGFLVVRVPDARAFAAEARGDPHVRYVEADRADYRALVTSNDPYYTSGALYGVKDSTTGIERAWNVTLGSPDVQVCVVDTGQYRAHQDLAGVRWGGWRDFVGGKANAYDDNGHGTHVTGTVAAALGNGKGIAGVAPGVTVSGAKVLNRQGSGTYSAVANGIAWCADQGAEVASLSLGGSWSQTVENAVRYATGKGTLVVAAAGNSGPCTNCVGWPARHAEVLAVACTTKDNAKCSFSSSGPEVDVAAPGLGIPSTWPAGAQPCGKWSTNCYRTISGTSMSTPHVSGLAALVWSVHPDWNGTQVADRITSTAKDLGPAGEDNDFGAGLIRYEAVT